jgi:hypothetical protein
MSEEMRISMLWNTKQEEIKKLKEEIERLKDQAELFFVERGEKRALITRAADALEDWCKGIPDDVHAARDDKKLIAELRKAAE